MKCGNNPIVTIYEPVYTRPQQTLIHRETQVEQFTSHPEQYFTQGIAFRGHKYVQFSSLIDVERNTHVLEQDEMLKRMKRFKQHMKSMQWLGAHRGIAFKDLCIFPNVKLPPGFKTTKFIQYNGQGDTISHTKRYYNQLRGVLG